MANHPNQRNNNPHQAPRGTQPNQSPRPEGNPHRQDERRSDKRS